MPTYVSLVEYTQQGIEDIEASPARLEEAKELTESLGGELTDFFLTFGEYDIVTVSEFPDDQTAARFVLSVARGGAVSTETLKAFPEDEYREIIDAL